MRTACAFHPHNIITQFCKCQPCLLPLCPQCLPIHLTQHSTMQQKSNICPIQSVTKQISSSIQNQHKYIDTITLQTINKYRESDQQHRKLFNDIIKQRDKFINWVNTVYDSIIVQLESNARRRQGWIREFNQSVGELKEELNSLSASLMGEKYLRVVIMWNKMRPNQAIQEITKKAEKKWLMPTFSGCTQEQVVDFISNSTNLKVLEIQGDSGVNKILNIIRVLRYGDPQTSTKTSLSSLQQKQNHNQIQHSKQAVQSKDHHIQPAVHSHSQPPPNISYVPPPPQHRVSQVAHFNSIPISPIPSMIPNMIPNTHLNHPTPIIQSHQPQPQLQPQPQHQPQPQIIPQPQPQKQQSQPPNLNQFFNQKSLMPQSPVHFNSPTRKTSTKKLQVLSSFQFHKQLPKQNNKQFVKNGSQVGQGKL